MFKHACAFICRHSGRFLCVYMCTHILVSLLNEEMMPSVDYHSRWLLLTVAVAVSALVIFDIFQALGSPGVTFGW